MAANRFQTLIAHLFFRRSSRQLIVSALIAIFALNIFPSLARAAEAMIFFNGNMGTVDVLTASEINGVRASGFNTIVIFNLRVDANGNFLYGSSANYPIACSNGVFAGDPSWAGLLAQCKTSPSSVTRIEMCVGGWTDPSFGNIRTRIGTDGTNSTTALYQNLVALKNALPIDAIDFDTENTYDSTTDSQFGRMCVSAGLKVTLCPYTSASYWQTLKSNLGTNCDKVYLQCYDGGNGNDPATWNTYFGGLKVIAGYWDNERDSTFVTRMQTFKNAGAIGGFLWPSCTGCTPPADGNEMLQYASWIQTAFSSVSMPATAVETVGNPITFTASSFVGSGFGYQWLMVKSGVTNIITGATNLTLTFSNLQLTNAGTYLVRATSSSGTFYSSTSSLTINGVPAPVNNVVTRSTAQTGLGNGFAFTPTWALDSNDLLLGRVPSTTNGNFNLEAQAGARNVNSLTAGGSLTINAVGSPLTCSSNYVTCGNGSSAGSTIIYTLTNTSPSGYNLTNITVYGGWQDNGRDQQAYTIYYAKSSAPSTFVLLNSVSYNPVNAASAFSASKVMLTPGTGFLATNVVALKFDFTTPVSENGYCGYAQITASGVSVSPAVVSDTLPAAAVDVVGSQVTFTANISGASPMIYQWRKISGGITNDIPGGTGSTLTLTNLQLGDAASYYLVAANNYGSTASTPRALTVNSLPAPVNNVIAAYAAQTGLGGALNDFYTTWTVVPGNLIAGLAPSSVGSGNFSDPFANECGTVAVLTDGSFGYLHSIPGNGGSPAEVAGGSGAGQSVTYTLPASIYGYNLTNITVYGGWGDAGRDQQAYTVYYSTISAPNTFVALGTVNYNPSDPLGVHSATRSTLTPASGYLATNVAALKFDFTTPAPENGYTGYSEIQVFGALNVPPPLPTTLGAGMASGNNLLMNIGNMVIDRTYEVQSTTNLLSPVWITETNFVAGATNLWITNSIDDASQKYYRVIGR